jgi:hypothetical protein
MLENVSVKTWELGQDPAWVLSELDSITHIGTNYDPEYEYGVQQFIKNGILDSYSILYRNDKMISGCGTRPMIIVPTHGTCYQIAVRGFRIPQRGLKQDYFTLDVVLPYQIARGRSQGFDKCFMSFNLHNERLKDNLDRNWVYPRTTSGPHIVNGVTQWIYLF